MKTYAIINVKQETFSIIKNVSEEATLEMFIPVYTNKKNANKMLKYAKSTVNHKLKVIEVNLSEAIN